MTSTRNNNTNINYKTQQLQDENYINNHMYLGYHLPNKEILPEIGPVSSRRSQNSLSNNFIDIESSLFGINSTNLVNPQKPINPQLKNIPLQPYFYRPNYTIIPNPFIVDENRPFLL
tara:strand:- start:3699 stop:4049 length:351 start_codon:yes stop_codon:yes gene_type:complete